MSAFTLELIAAAILFLVAVGTGLRLSALHRRGGPLNAAVMAVHKIVALVSGALLILAVVQVARVAALELSQWAALAVTALLLLLLGVSGALLSFDRPLPAAVRLLHGVLSLLAALAVAGTGILLARGLA
jgi:hypothetical protein